MMFRTLTAAAAIVALMGSGGCSLLGSNSATSGTITEAAPEETGGIGVNAYLWRATLDTLSFMPLASADPWGGVVTTDWYANPEKPDERFKVTVYILDTRLRADGISAAVAHEQMSNGQWQTAAVTPGTNEAMENAILARARELRLSSVQ